MDIQVFTPRFFRLLGSILAATLVAFVALQGGVAHAAASSGAPTNCSSCR